MNGKQDIWIHDAHVAAYGDHSVTLHIRSQSIDISRDDALRVVVALQLALGLPVTVNALP